MNTYKQSAVDFLEMVVAGNIDAAFAKHIDMKGRHHNIFTPSGFPALRKGMQDAHAKFPDKQFAIQHVLGDDDMVSVHSRMALEKGQPAMAVMHLFRFEHGKIVEMWDIAQSIADGSTNTDGVF